MFVMDVMCSVCVCPSVCIFYLLIFVLSIRKNRNQRLYDDHVLAFRLMAVSNASFFPNDNFFTVSYSSCYPIDFIVYK
jgi:hypothetical protein